MDFNELERREGVRLSWNAWPCSRIEATRVVLPIGALVTPGRDLGDAAPTLPYEPVVCERCQAALNPYCSVDYYGKTWRCSLCDGLNKLPRNYEQISENNLPAELFPTYTSVEYTMTNKTPTAPCFVLCVDCACGSAEELQDAKDSVMQLVSLLPEDAFVGLVTFGSTVRVHELAETNGAMRRSYVFRGTKDCEQEDLRKMLGLDFNRQRAGMNGMNGMNGAAAMMPNGVDAKPVRRFVAPISECEFTLQSVLDEVTLDEEKTERGKRALRAMGAAISIAAGLLAESHSSQGGRVLTFTSGPCTVGPGAVVGTDMSENLRSHQDLEKNAAKHYKEACKVYNAIGIRLATNSHTLDVFACSLDQVGLAEMKIAVDQTGGNMILAEQFRAETFRQSLAKMFARDPKTGALEMKFNGTFSVFCTPQIMVCGAIGPISALAVKSQRISENEIGLGQTTSWRMCSFTPTSTIAVYYEVVNQHSNPIPNGQPFFLQFCTRYKTSDGQIRLRVTTVARRWVESSLAPEIVGGFDQEACAVLMARIATFRTENEESFDLLRWLDRTLIRVGAKFGEYQRDAPDSFRMPPSMSIYPQFIFHLRRSQFLQTANNSPDETAFYRIMLSRETVTNSLVMIQPTLLSYSFNGPPQPVLLDVSAITPDTILLLDSYFLIVAHRGSTIAAWHKAGYQDQPEHEAFRALLAAPVRDAKALAADRCPTPRLVECNQGGSQARFLLAKLNPSATHNTDLGYGQSGGEIIFTDDISMNVFVDHLAKLAVSS
jgi:protein transport protein SEC23